MEYCGPHGIPHSRFLGWSSEDQDKALGWLLDSKSRCQSCGSYTEDWLDEDGREVWPEPHHAESELCVGCRRLEEERERIRSSKVATPTAYRTVLRPGPPPEPEEFEEDESELE